MANNIARLGVLLGLDSAEFVKGIEAAGKKLADFADKAASYGKFGAAALLVLTQQALAYADEIADVAKANDIAIDSILKLSNALGNAGGKAEDAGKLIAGFTKFVDNAAEGSFEAQKSFSKAGISLKDLGKLSSEDLLQKTIQGLAKITDPLTRNAKAMEIFGKAAKGVDFTDLANGMNSVTKATEAQAEAIKQAADFHDLLAERARDTLIVLSVELGPILKLTTDYIKEMTGETNIMGKVFGTVFETIVISGANAAFVIKAIADEIMHTIENAKILWTGGIAAAIALNEAHSAKWEEERRRLDEFESKIMNRNFGGILPSQMSSWDDVAAKPAVKRPVKAGVDPEVEKRKAVIFKAMMDELQETERIQAEIAEIYKKADDKILADWKANEALKFQLLEDELRNEQQIQEEIGIINNRYAEGNAIQMESQKLDEKDLARTQEMFKLEQYGLNMKSEDLQFEKDRMAIENKRADAIERINANSALTSDAREEALLRENALAQEAIRLAAERNRIIKEAKAGTFEEGFFKGIDKFVNNLATDMENGQKAFESVMNNMSQALDTFVKTGKLNFKDFARSIIQDLIAIQLKAQANSLLSMAFKMFTGGGEGLGANYAKADGGSVSGNNAYLVGERGPEIFMPSGSGTIIPNHSLSMGGGTTNVTNNYISAIDVKSFEDRLLGSSNTIWAANAYANKSLAVSRGRT